MTTPITEGIQFARCPECQAVNWPGWSTTHRHRPPCDYADTDPNTWKLEETQ